MFLTRDPPRFPGWVFPASTACRSLLLLVRRPWVVFLARVVLRFDSLRFVVWEFIRVGSASGLLRLAQHPPGNPVFRALVGYAYPCAPLRLSACCIAVPVVVGDYAFRLRVLLCSLGYADFAWNFVAFFPFLSLLGRVVLSGLLLLGLGS